MQLCVHIRLSKIVINLPWTFSIHYYFSLFPLPLLPLFIKYIVFRNELRCHLYKPTYMLCETSDEQLSCHFWISGTQEYRSTSPLVRPFYVSVPYALTDTVLEDKDWVHSCFQFFQCQVSSDRMITDMLFKWGNTSKLLYETSFSYAHEPE